MTNVDIKELLLSGKNRLDVCNPFVYKQYKHFYSVGACISLSIKKWYHRLVSSRHWEISENGKMGLRGIPKG